MARNSFRVHDRKVTPKSGKRSEQKHQNSELNSNFADIARASSLLFGGVGDSSPDTAFKIPTSLLSRPGADSLSTQRSWGEEPIGADCV